MDSNMISNGISHARLRIRRGEDRLWDFYQKSFSLLHGKLKTWRDYLSANIKFKAVLQNNYGRGLNDQLLVLLWDMTYANNLCSAASIASCSSLLFVVQFLFDATEMSCLLFCYEYAVENVFLFSVIVLNSAKIYLEIPIFLPGIQKSNKAYQHNETEVYLYHRDCSP